MKNIKQIVFLVSLLLFLQKNHTESVECTREAQDQLSEMKTDKNLVSRIVSLGLKGFPAPTQAQKIGYDRSKFEEYLELVQCANNYITIQVNAGRSNKIYNSFIQDLKNATDYIQETLKRNLSTPSQTIVNNLIKNLNTHLDKVQKVDVFVLRTAIAPIAVPEDWKKAVPKNSTSIISDSFYNQIYKEYDKQKKLSSNFQDPEAFKTFLTTLGMSNEGMNNESKITTFLSNLEKYAYSLQDEYNNAWPWNKNTILGKKQITQEILNQALNIYPNILTSQISAKLAEVTDRPSLLLLAQAELLLIALDKLKSDITNLRKK